MFRFLFARTTFHPIQFAWPHANIPVLPLATYSNRPTFRAAFHRYHFHCWWFGFPVGKRIFFFRWNQIKVRETFFFAYFTQRLGQFLLLSYLIGQWISETVAAFRTMLIFSCLLQQIFNALIFRLNDMNILESEELLTSSGGITYL